MKQYRTKTTHVLINRTLETVSAACDVVGINDDGTPEYSGDKTEIFYDEMRQKEEGGKLVYLDEDGESWTFDELEPVPEGEDGDEAEG